MKTPQPRFPQGHLTHVCGRIPHPNSEASMKTSIELAAAPGAALFIHNPKLVLAAGLLLALPLAAQGPASGGPGNGTGGGSCLVATTAPLSAEEAATLSFMREEERLAHDMYDFLGQTWNFTIFINIEEAETRHFEALGTLLVRFGLPDPSAGLPQGIYAYPELTEFYASLKASGVLSAVEALKVGVAIENHDIEDLEKALAGTSNPALKRVYTNLLEGSYNHLEAFQSCLEVCPAN